MTRRGAALALTARARVRQVTSSAADSRAAGASRGFPVIVIESRADLVPEGPGNADGSLEILLRRYR